METTHYFKKEMRFKAELIANRLGTSKDVLVSILQGVGFKISRVNDHLFSGAQIRAIAEAYVESVHISFNKYVHKCKTGALVDEYERNYFYQFVDSRTRHFQSTVLESWILDEELIKESFYRLISSSRTRVDEGSALHNAVLRFMSIQVMNYVMISRNVLQKIIPPKLFFTYIDEEDSFNDALNQTGFAVAGN